MKTPTPIRPPETLPQSLIDAMQEADELGIKEYKSYIGWQIGAMLEAGGNDDLINPLLLEIQKRAHNRLISLESWLIKDISDHKSKRKGQLVKFRR